MTANRLMRFPDSVKRDPAIDAWLQAQPGSLGATARHWFDVMRRAGNDVQELLHDGHPTACIGDVAFGYVNVFTAHLNVGFFHGADLPDPGRLLVGTGKFMRHVKLGPDHPADPVALAALIEAAYTDLQRRLDDL